MKPSTLRKLLEKQATLRTCTQGAPTTALRKTIFTFDTDGPLLWIFSIDGASQRHTVTTPHQRMLLLGHHSLLPVYASRPREYDTIRQHLYWPHLDNDVYTKVANCMSCRQNHSTKKIKEASLLPPTSPLDVFRHPRTRPLTEERTGEYVRRRNNGPLL